MRRPINSAVLGALSMLGLACGSDEAVTGLPEVTQVPVNTLVFTRANQTRITFASGARLYVWCGAWEPGLINTPSVHVLYGGPTSNDPFWQISAVAVDIKLGQPLSFPNTFVFDQPRNADMFVSDPNNELSTQVNGSSGSITFTGFACTSGSAVEFSINAVLGSEFGGGPSVTISGNFRGYVGQPPQ